MRFWAKIDSFSQVSSQRMGKNEIKDGFVIERTKKLKIRFWANIDNFSQVSSQRMGKNEKKRRFCERKRLRNRRCDFGQK